MTLRAFQLQVVQGNLWHQRAMNQTTERTELPAARGGLFDRNMRPLTVSQDKHRAFFAPAEVEDRAGAIEAFRQILELGRRDVDRLDTADTGWVPLGQVSGRTKDQLESLVRTGVHFEAVPARAYPEGKLARGLLGVVGSDGAGLSGLELVFDSLLAGRPGEQLSRRDAHGALYPIRDASSVPARSGRDVVLTIDADLQEIAESALARALRETSAAGGDIILADPATGEILALASRRDDSPYGIPAFTDAYEPGSTAKPFLFAALLQEDLARLDETIDVEGGTYRTPYRTITDVHEFETLSVSDVMLHSSNIGAAKLAERIEPGLQYSYLRDFGFGTPTGVETASESHGRLARPSEWSLLSQQSLAYGYELTVTSIQLIAAYGALANDGILMRPTLVREIRSPDGRTELRNDPRPLRRIVDEQTADQITDLLIEVVREGGTGDEAALHNIDIAGKTGTSRVSAGGTYATGKYVASFVGYVPADDPQLVVLAKLDDPKTTIYGGAAAAPVSRTVMQAILAAGESGLLAGHLIRGADARHEWGTPEPDATPYRFAANGPPRDLQTSRAESGELLVPDVRGLGLRAAAARLYEVGLEVELRDDVTQRVRRSEPAPGSRVVPGSIVLLR